MIMAQNISWTAGKGRACREGLVKCACTRPPNSVLLETPSSSEHSANSASLLKELNLTVGVDGKIGAAEARPITPQTVPGRAAYHTKGAALLLGKFWAAKTLTGASC